jgi:hypothetical protein
MYSDLQLARHAVGLREVRLSGSLITRQQVAQLFTTFRLPPICFSGFEKASMVWVS